MSEPDPPTEPAADDPPPKPSEPPRGSAPSPQPDSPAAEPAPAAGQSVTQPDASDHPGRLTDPTTRPGRFGRWYTRPAVVFAAGVVVALLGVGGWWLFGDDDGNGTSAASSSGSPTAQAGGPQAGPEPDATRSTSDDNSNHHSDDQGDDDGSDDKADDGGDNGRSKDPSGKQKPVNDTANLSPVPAGPPATPSAQCPTGGTTVGNAQQLTQALAQAQPGTTIHLQDGTYQGRFTLGAKGTAGAPVFVCGGQGAVLDGGGVKGGYVLHLDGAAFVHLVGFAVHNGQKGVVADHTSSSVIQGLTVDQIGDEAIHLRAFSSDNIVAGNTVHNTGQRRDKFGEGIYVGSAESNWCNYSQCKPDKSDRNAVIGNTVTDTTSESVDIKEGTSGGVLAGNTFDGAKLSGADSWVDVKGTNWLITGNSGRSSKVDGFQTHEILPGWGTGNVFTGNTAAVSGSGFGFHLAPVRDNRVACDNKVTDAAQGLASVPCR